MKGYKLDKTLYIFDATPATIPFGGHDGQQAVDIIYVQQELVADFKNYNPDVEKKIKPYNYKLLVVNKLPWADYIDNDLVEDGGSSTTEYTVSVNFGQTLLKYLPDSLPFEPSMPYSATAGTQLVFTLPWEWGWLDNREGNTDGEFKIQIQYPESIQDSYAIVWPDVTYEDEDIDQVNPTYVDGSLSFIMPAENVTLNIDLVENPDYNPEPEDPEEPVETELTVVNNLPEGWTCEIAKLSGVDGDEEPVPIDVSNPVTLYENDEVFVKVFNENKEPVNYFNDADMHADSYSRTHESAEAMRTLNVYCSIEGDFNDEITTDDLGYNIWGRNVAAAHNSGYGESFFIPSIPLTLTIQKP